MEVHQVELPVTFEGGVGTTQTISAEEVWFTTRRALGVGQRISGVLCFPPVSDGVAPALSFAGCVAVTAPSLEGDGTFEVWVRFERIAFAAIDLEHQDRRDPAMSRKHEEDRRPLPGSSRASTSIGEIDGHSRELGCLSEQPCPAQGG